jgi:peptidoglycan/LPS O-acetylase OafA/YrhL
MTRRAKYRVDIQVLRGLAVLAVVLFHASEHYFQLGYLGVDVFFVISGMVVTPLMYRIFTEPAVSGKRIKNLRFFYVQRIFRLGPALAITLVISTFVIFLLANFSEHQRFARQGIATLFLLGNFGANRYSGDYFSPNPNPIVHTWSLSVEEQIYLFLPLLFGIAFQFRKNPKLKSQIILSVLFASSLASFLIPTLLNSIYYKVGINPQSGFSFYSPIDRLWQFLLGSFAFFMIERRKKSNLEISTAVQVCLMFALFLILFSPLQLNLRAGSILASLITFAILLFNTLKVLPDLVIKKFSWLGDRSYSIYLVHMPLLYIAKHSPITKLPYVEGRTIQTIIAVAASLFLGALMYSKVENRYRLNYGIDVIRKPRISVPLVLVFILPLCLFLAMDVGSRQKYWGLDRSPTKPNYAGFADPNCERDSVAGPPCIYDSGESARTVLLIGDSHAGHISQAVVDAARSVGWKSVIWTHSGCLIQLEKAQEGNVLTDLCIENNRLMYKWVKLNKPELVIVSQRIMANSSQLELRRGLSSLKEATKYVLLVENTPEFPDGGEFMVNRETIIQAPFKLRKSFKVSEMSLENKAASDELATWARSNDILTLNLSSIFCNASNCTRFSDGYWLYRDTDHLSLEGGSLTKPAFEAFLRKLK